MSGNFNDEFGRLHRALIRGRLSAIALSAFAGAGAGWLLFGAADARFSFEPGERVAGTAILATLVGAGVAYASFRKLRVSREEVARRIDARRADGRASASGALGLDATSGTPLARWLAEQELVKAAEGVSSLRSSSMFPKKTLRRAACGVVVAAVVATCLFAFAPEATSLVASRLAHPLSDAPPWSRLRFAVSPGRPSVLYGGALDVAVTISGDAPATAECLVRDVVTGARLRLPAFRESPGRFTRRLENITGPVEIAFACGRARSEWLPVEVLYRPVILSGKMTVKPPSYTGLKPMESVLDATEIRVPEGAEITLRLACNRPLAGGEALFTPKAVPGRNEVQKIVAKTDGGTEAAFTWIARGSGDLVLTLEDVRGTRSPKPLKLALRMLPDAPPEVALVNPQPLLLATPTTVVPISGTAKDDYGLASVRLVRALSGFRDRSETVEGDPHAKEYGYTGKLDLRAAGAEAGQTIEVMLEASDFNPSLMGRGGSEVSRIVVISEDRYAEILRSQATLEEFAPRFAALAQAVEKARAATEALEEAAASGDAAAMRKAREAALTAHRGAALEMERIAADFPAFSMEKRLRDLSKKNLDAVRENIAELDKTDASDAAGLANAARDAAARLGRNAAGNEALKRDAAAVAAAGRVLEMAARFQKIYLDQRSVTQRLLVAAKQVDAGDAEGARSLPSLGETQRKIAEELKDFKKELVERRHGLPHDYADMDKLHRDVGAFLAALDEADPGSAMDASGTFAANADSVNAFRKSELALSLLDKLMKKKGNGFCDACNGTSPKFQVDMPDVNDTLAQMLSGLCEGNKPGDGPPKNGQGGGSGWGAGGASPSGYAMSGVPIPRNIPVYGPKRSAFTPLSLAGRSHGKGRTPGGLAPTVSEATGMKPAGDRDGDGRAPASENIPENYRDAVKRYFGK